jgi:hypothetical protein
MSNRCTFQKPAYGYIKIRSYPRRIMLYQFGIQSGHAARKADGQPSAAYARIDVNLLFQDDINMETRMLQITALDSTARSKGIDGRLTSSNRTTR